jgi:Iron-containing redox enzyme
MERLVPPPPRGELSASLLRRCTTTDAPLAPVGEDHDPLTDDDLQLALFLAYELHHRGIQGVDDAREWDPGLLAWRATLERQLEVRLRDSIVPAPGRGRVSEQLTALIAQADGPSLSRYMETAGTHDDLREFVVHRSAYQLREADGHTWAIPRFGTASRRALVAIQLDEYGGGVPGRSHHELFAATMRALDLDPTYGRYVALLPATTLATVNLLSWFGLHRARLGALVGHLTVFEMTSVEPMARYSAALHRLGLGVGARAFYDAHVVADAEHSRLAAVELADRFVAERPERRRDVVFGAQALLLVEDRFARALLGAFTAKQSSLLRSLGDERGPRRAVA